MKKILTASSDKTIVETVRNACKKYSSYFEYIAFDETEQVINYIDFEIPEIKVLDFSSSCLDSEKILNAIKSDAWLHYGGIIAVCATSAQVAEIEEMKDFNILAVMTVKDFQKHFSRLLRILWKNQQFLFSRGMQDIAGGLEAGAFICDNDPMDIRFYTNFITLYLYNINKINDEIRVNLQMMLMELLTNSLEHGNLEITYEEKTEWMMSGKDMIRVLAERAALPEYADRKIHISFEIGKKSTRFTIRDDGKGFDWRKMMLKDSEDNELHGRGISLSQNLGTNLIYNEKGNQVSFIIANSNNVTNSVPGIMQKFEAVTYPTRTVLFREDDRSNDLFFIVSGRYAVYSGKKLISVLTPNDMFIGEMAFLTNDRRSATVVTVGECKLIKLSKAAFLSLIRKNPHYGIFLSRMLAQRLLKQTQQTIKYQSLVTLLEAGKRK